MITSRLPESPFLGTDHVQISGSEHDLREFIARRILDSPALSANVTNLVKSNKTPDKSIIDTIVQHSEKMWARFVRGTGTDLTDKRLGFF